MGIGLVLVLAHFEVRAPSASILATVRDPLNAYSQRQCLRVGEMFFDATYVSARSMAFQALVNREVLSTGRPLTLYHLGLRSTRLH